MDKQGIRLYQKPELNNPVLLIGLSGWMNSGEVSTAVVSYLVNKLSAREFAAINPEGFYIENFPGNMEIASIFRPTVKISEGIVKKHQNNTNRFFFDRENDLILFSGHEPHLNWQQFCDYIFEICDMFGVERIYFVGSVAGLVPHTREPRLHCSASDSEMKNYLDELGFNFTNYEGPGSIVTKLTVEAGRRNKQMAVMVATVPAYVQGNNPMALEAVIRRFRKILGIDIDINELVQLGEAFQEKIEEVVSNEPELAENIHKLEENYDNEVFDEDMGDLKQWLKKKGVKVD